MTAPRNIFARASGATAVVLRIADRVSEGLVVLLFAGIVLVGGLQVFCRYAVNASLSWSEEFQRYGLIWMVFLCLVIGYRRGAHLGMGFLLQKLPHAIQVPFAWLTDLLWLTLGLAMVVFTALYRSPAGLTFLSSVRRQSSAGMGLRMDLVYGCIVVGGTYLVLAALHQLLQRAGNQPPPPAASPAEEGAKPC